MASQHSILPQSHLITLWFLTSSLHPRDDVTFRNVSTVRVYCLKTPHNIQQRYPIFRRKSFLCPSKHSQQSNLTCIITITTQNSCLSYNMKSSSDLHSTQLHAHIIKQASQINLSVTMQRIFGRLHYSTEEKESKQPSTVDL